MNHRDLNLITINVLVSCFYSLKNLCVDSNTFLYINTFERKRFNCSIKGGTKKTGQPRLIVGYGGFYKINVVMKHSFTSKFYQHSEYIQFLGVGALWKHLESFC